jgi:hypothetical protein
VAQNRPKGKSWVPGEKRSGPGRRTSKLPRERGILEKGSEAIARATGMSSRVRSPLEVIKDSKGAGTRALAKVGLTPLVLGKGAGTKMIENIQKNTSTTGQSGQGTRGDKLKPKGKSWVPTGAKTGQGLPGMGPKEGRAKDDRTGVVKTAEAKAVNPPSIDRKVPPTTKLRSTGAPSKASSGERLPTERLAKGAPSTKPTPSPETATKHSKPKGSVGAASNRDIPSVLTVQRKGEPETKTTFAKGKNATTVISKPGDVKSVNPNVARKDVAPIPQKEVKKGFFASLFNAREGASTRDSYDRTGFKKKAAKYA